MRCHGGEQHFFFIDERSGFFDQDLGTGCSCWAWKCAFNVFKNSKRIIPNNPITHIFYLSFTELRFLGLVEEINPCKSIDVCVDIVTPTSALASNYSFHWERKKKKRKITKITFYFISFSFLFHKQTTVFCFVFFSLFLFMWKRTGSHLSDKNKR